MTMKDDDENLHFLLSGARLSGAQREQILDRVTRETGARRPRRWFSWMAVALVPTAAVAAIALVIGTRNDGRPPIAKGAGAGPVLQARCPNREPGRCRTGDRLVFEVDGATKEGLLAAYAQRASGERVWYFPTVGGYLATVPGRPGHDVIGDGVRLGDEHPPGTYQVHLMLLDGPADRAQVIAGRVRARAEAVVPLQILPP